MLNILETLRILEQGKSDDDRIKVIPDFDFNRRREDVPLFKRPPGYQEEFMVEDVKTEFFVKKKVTKEGDVDTGARMVRIRGRVTRNPRGNQVPTQQSTQQPKYKDYPREMPKFKAVPEGVPPRSTGTVDAVVVKSVPTVKGPPKKPPAPIAPQEPPEGSIPFPKGITSPAKKKDGLS